MVHIGFIGCGSIARHHATRMSALRGVRITAAADVCPETAADFAKDFDIPFHTSNNQQLLERSDVDAVWVCTPTYQHKAPVLAAARAGKHIFCEKPMALKVTDAERMAEACAKAGVHLTIGFVRRFDTQWGKLRQIVQSGAVGKPLVWRFCAGGRPQKAWFRDVHKGAGPLMDGAAHNYDFALQMLGPVASVQASSLQFDPTSVGADTATAILNFVSGDQHSLVWSWGTASGVPVAGLHDVIGPRGSLSFGMSAARPPKTFDSTRQGAFTLKQGNGKERVYTYRLQDMFVEQLKHVTRSFARNQQPLVEAADGIAALRVAVAVLKSGATRRTVKL